MTPVNGTARNPGMAGVCMAEEYPGSRYILHRSHPAVRTVSVSKILPRRHQVELPQDQLILTQPPSAEALEMDVTFVGAGPAGLAGAIELARLVKQDQESGGTMPDLNIAVLEKAGSLGEHNLSGAVVNPRAFRELFPELTDK